MSSFYEVTVTVSVGAIPNQIQVEAVEATPHSAQSLRHRALSAAYDEIGCSLQGRKRCPMRGTAVERTTTLAPHTKLAAITCTFTPVEVGSDHIKTRIELFDDDWLVGYKALLLAKAHMHVLMSSS